MLRCTAAMAAATVVATAAFLGASAVPVAASPAALAAPSGDPWGPPHVLYRGRSAEAIAQATTTDGTTVVVFQPNPRRGASATLVAIRRSGEEWATPLPLTDRRAFEPKVLAWGAGQLSVIWSSPAGTNNYRFHIRSLTADGTLGNRERLIKAEYAYRSYQAAINSAGQVALAWSNGDLYDRVVVRRLDGSWASYPRVPVQHPTCCGGLQYISNPRALFLDDAGRVSIITWGTVEDSDRAIWLARPANDGWSTQRVGPVDGGRTEYGYVDTAAYASNPRGDLVVTWPQKDAAGAWSARLRFARAGHQLGEPTTLSTYWCFIDDPSPCAGVAIANDGTATVAYARDAGGEDIVVEMVRRGPDGTFTPAQAVSGEIWRNPYDGVQVAGNAGGDAVVSFVAGDRASSEASFARCPAAQPCAETVWVEDDPSWLDLWTTSMGDDAEVTVTWSVFYRDGVETRQLAGVG